MKNFLEPTQFLKFQKNSVDLYSNMIENVCKPYGLSKSEGEVLLFFANNPSFVSAIDVVKVRGFSKAYVSKAIESLLEKSLISIRVNKSDRRYQEISLSNLSKPMVLDLQKAQYQFLEILTKDFSDEEKFQIIEIIRKFSQNVSNAIEDC